MDTRTGRVITHKEMLQLEPQEREHYVEIEPTPRQSREQRVRRNDPCPCGSGKKFKRCCLREPVPVALPP